MPSVPENYRDFKSLLQIVSDLRGPDGCPWDKEQSHQTLTQYALEEAFELAEALDGNDTPAIIEELGDVLLQVVLHAEIARQAGEFNIDDVIEAIGRKMVRRHPHVFADVKVTGSAEVLDNWASIKASENPEKARSYFNLPKGLPALIQSQKIGSKTKKYNFDWKTTSEVMSKVEEELGELKAAMASGTGKEQQAEMGDLLFSLAQLARHMNFDSEQALRQTNTRFIKRFTHMMDLAVTNGHDPKTTASNQLEVFWEQAKAAEKETPA